MIQFGMAATNVTLQIYLTMHGAEACRRCTCPSFVVALGPLGRFKLFFISAVKCWVGFVSMRVLTLISYILSSVAVLAHSLFGAVLLWVSGQFYMSVWSGSRSIIIYF